MDGGQGSIMGKAIIIENLENAMYKVGLVYDKTELQAKVDVLDIRIAEVQIEIDEAEEGTTKESLKLIMLSLQKTRTKYNDFLVEECPEYTVYCADFSDELTGNIGTIELVGDPNKFLQIKPGYNGEASYDSGRDGQLVYTTGLTPACDYYNYAIKPGWQKWMPKYRYGTITSILEDVCDVVVEACWDGGFDLNHKTSFSDVNIEYMGEANGEPFKAGDEVLIQLDDWDSPLVVGFKIPRRANPLLVLTVNYAGKDDYVVVWESALNAASETIPLNAGGYATFPCQKSLISDWLNNTKDISNNLWTTTTKGFDATWVDYDCTPEINESCTKETFHENECPGINGELLEDYISYQRSKTATNYGARYDDFIYWIPNEIEAYLPKIDENFNFNSMQIQAINGSGYTGSMLIYLYHLYYEYFIYSYGNSWTNYFDSKKYTIKTPIGDFELLETDSFIFDSGTPEVKSDNYLDPLYGNLIGKYSKTLFSQIYWIQYKYSGDTETDRTISVIAQSKVVEDATTISPNNALERDTLLETSITNLINTWYINNGYVDRDIVNCSLSIQLVV